jgi:hypothetical protein
MRPKISFVHKKNGYFFQELRGVTLGSQAFIFGTTVLYGLYAPLVPVRFSVQGCEMIQSDRKP